MATRSSTSYVRDQIEALKVQKKLEREVEKALTAKKKLKMPRNKELAITGLRPKWLASMAPSHHHRLKRQSLWLRRLLKKPYRKPYSQSQNL